MRRAVVDASLVLAASLGPDAPSVRRAREVLAGMAVVEAPALIGWEVAHAVHRKAPRAFGPSVGERAAAVADLLAGVDLAPADREALVRTGTLAEERGLSAYDAAYLELAARDDLALLLTLDRDLHDAARVVLGPERVFDPKDFLARFEPRT